MTSLVLNRRDANGTHAVETVLNVKENKEIEIYDIITPYKFGEDDPAVSVEDITNVLNDLDGDLTIRVNSRGGEVGTALTIYNRIKAYDKGETVCIVDGYAFSSAGWIPMACDRREIATGGIFMNHNPRMYPEIKSLKDLASVQSQWEAHHKSIVDIFDEAVPISREEIVDMMEKETFLSAEDAVEKGFFHAVHNSKANLKALNMAPVVGLPDEYGITPAETTDVSNLISQRNSLLSRHSQLLGN